MKIFQILHNRCHWQTPFTSLAETVGKFPPDCLFVEAPDYVNEQWGFDETEIGDDRFIKPEAPDGWIYDEESGQFYPEDMAKTRLQEAQNAKQEENNRKLEEFLNNHPITWTDGKLYGVSKEDQNEIALNLNVYQMALAAGEENPVLEWHAAHEACVPWTQENLVALSLAIRNFVYPWYTLNQTYKTQIFSAETVKDVEAIELVYKTEEELAAENQTEEDTTEEDTSTDSTTESTEDYDASAKRDEIPAEENNSEASTETTESDATV